MFDTSANRTLLVDFIRLHASVQKRQERFGGTWVHDFVTRQRPPLPTRIVQLALVEPR